MMRKKSRKKIALNICIYKKKSRTFASLLRDKAIEK